MVNNAEQLMKAAYDAENALFAEYGVTCKNHLIPVEQYGIKVRVTETGEGPPLIVIPGNVGEAYPFIPLLPELYGRTVYLINRPGGGMSGSVDYRQADFRQLAVDTIKKVIDALSIKHADLVGHSIGGHWALWFTTSHPEYVRTLALLGVPGGLPGTGVPIAMKFLHIPGVETAVKRFARSRPGYIKVPESICGPRVSDKMADCRTAFMALPDYLPSFFSMIKAEPVYRKQILSTESLRGVKTPAILIWGTNDPFGKPKAGRMIANTLPSGSFSEILGGSHLPWLNQPEQCGRLIRAFWET